MPWPFVTTFVIACAFFGPSVCNAGRLDPPERDKLLATLRDTEADAAARADAIEMIARERFEDQGVIEALFHALGDPTLGDAEDRQLVDILVRIARVDPSLHEPLLDLAGAATPRQRRAAARAAAGLAHAHPGASLHAALKLSGSPDQATRRGAYTAINRALLEQPELSPQAMDALRAGLIDPAPLVRRIATMTSPGHLPPGEVGRAFADRLRAGEFEPENLVRLRIHVETARACAESLLEFLAQLDVANPRLLTQGLRALAMTDESVLTLIVARIDDENVELRRAAAWVMAHVPDSQPVMDAILIALSDEDPVVAASAAQALGQLDAATSVDRLGPLTRDERIFIRRGAAAGVAALLPRTATAVQLVPPLVNDPDPGVRRVIAQAPLPKPPNSALEFIDALSKSTHADVRRHASWQFERLWSRVEFSPHAELRRTALPTRMVALAEDPDASVRTAAFKSILAMRIGSAPVIACAVHGLDDETAAVRGAAARALGPAERNASLATPRLLELLEDENVGVRRDAVTALGSVGRGSDRVATALLRELDRPAQRAVEQDHRRAVLMALGQVDANVASIVPALRAELEAPTESLRLAAIQALVATGPARDEVLQAVHVASESETERVRRVAVETLGTWSGFDVSAGAVLRAVMESARIDNRVRACSWAGGGPYGGPGPVADELLSALAVCLAEDADENVRRAALQAIARIDPEAPSVRKSLIAALADTHTQTRGRSASLLAAHGPAAIEAATALIALLDDPDSRTGGAAARALGAIGAVEAIPALERAAARTDMTGQYARVALKQLREK